jgi:glucose/arabinose dehydrogenase
MRSQRFYPGFALLGVALLTVPARGALVHRWTFSETSGTNLFDLVGTATASIVTLSGGGGYQLDGRRVRLDGGARSNADYVIFPTNTFAGLTNVTVEMWAIPHSFQNYGRVFEIGTGVDNDSSGRLFRASFATGTNGDAPYVGLWPTVINYPTPTPVDREYHYVMTWSASGQLLFYRDGALVASQNTAGTNIATIAALSTPTFWLGRSHFASDSTANASWNEVRIYDAVLDAPTIQNDFRRGAENSYGMLHRWTFSETTGTNISDSVATALGSVVQQGTPDYTWGSGQLTLSGGARGSADYVAFPSRRLDGLTNMSIEVWATPNAAQNWSRVFDIGDGVTPTTSFFLSFTRGTDLNSQRLEFIPSGTADSQLGTTTGVQYHDVVTWDQSAGACSWYRNGTFVTSFALNSQTLANVTNSVFWLGRSHYAADSTASASYNDLRVYNRVLTTDEILYHFQQGPNSTAPPPAVANPDSITLNPGGVALLSVLANDTTNRFDASSVSVLTSPNNGIATVKSNGGIFYTNSNFAAVGDGFSYRVTDILTGNYATGAVFVTITNSLRLPNTTITVPNVPPTTAYQVVDAFPGVTFTQPLAIRTPSGAAYSNLLFVVERRGVISYINAAAANPVKQTFFNITNQVSFDVSATDGELGLLGLEFHPGFATNGVFFAYYIAPNGGVWYDRLSRFTADPVALTVNTNTQQILFQMPDREFNHNGGDLHFGSDGYLYISMGDEGGQYNVHTNAQRLDGNLFSGILRIDVDKKPGSIEPTVNPGIPTDGGGHAFYSIPPDNPFLGVTSLYGVPVNTNALRGEFYAIGFRHPWRFAIDPFTAEIWVGDVGQDMWEEVEVIRKGGNYGWPYYEATHLTSTNYPTQPTMFPPPAGFVMDKPLYEYPHTSVPGSTAAFSGLDVCGQVVYHGSRIPALTNAFVFGDFDAAGNIWALRRSNSVVTVERLAGQVGLAAFGSDPVNGDVIMCNYLQNKLQRLVYADTSNSSFPTTLSGTGIYADMTTLAPNPGEVNYEPIVAFWSDYAVKRRWFCIPDMTNTITFVVDGNWTFPTGMKWIKHFDLELTRDDPSTKKRIETRVLVKTTNGVYGVSYAWNDAGTEATLVPDSGTNFNLTIQDGTNISTQNWEIPSRSACLACHTAVAGHALSFNTRELNQDEIMNGFAGNQIALLSGAGYFANPPAAPQTLPAFVNATNESCSLESRVRSYLAENCIQCHQPGGAGAATWDARPWLSLQMTRLINGTPDNNAGNPLNKIIVPGDTNHSVLLQHVMGNGFSRMPPLATHELDPGANSLLTRWIGTELTNYQSFADWQIMWFGSTNNPLAAPAADPDGDGANNYYEYLTHTSPLTNYPPPWKISIDDAAGTVGISFLRVANLGMVVETSTDLLSWAPWDVPENRLWFSVSNFVDTISGPVTSRFYRVRLYEP